MQVPVINRIKDVHMDLISLQNPSFSSGLPSVSFAYTFCKWGALILALVATFGSLVNKINVLIIKFRRRWSPLPSIPPLDDDDYSSSDDEDEEEEEETSSSSEFEEEEEEVEPTPSSSSSLKSSFNWRMAADEDFGVRGSVHQVDDRLQSGGARLRRRRSISDIFSLSEIVNSENVVKLWDSIGFGLGLDFDDGEIYAESLTRQPAVAAVSSSAPDVFLSAEKNASGRMAVKIWDSRIRRRLPAVITEWKPNLGKIVGVRFGEVEKFYVRDDVHNDVTIGDLRNVSSPLQNVTESDTDTWLDTDAVIVSAEN
ncbi:hypothetical protein QN277_003899 [Acacia crassicarpa]|uniref:Transmembrane protein n=1 Tax=Acacia crassicarpa TaxID=499986 RepID=A0AAE1J370_9FABA|nr:hypothetical protein QN277_003899 [Acacia crassicarpa]